MRKMGVNIEGIVFRKFCLVFAILVLLFSPVRSQQPLIFTQYMFNMSALNPAYTGTHEKLSLTAHIRSQWVDWDGAPGTQSFSVHSPLRGDRVALGLGMFHDKVGVTSVLSMTPSYAYRIFFGEDAILSLGIQAYVTNINANYTSLTPDQPGDEAFDEDVHRWAINFSTGAFLYSDNYYVSLSSPYLLKTRIIEGGGAEATDSDVADINPSMALAGGYLFSAGENLVLKPNSMVRFTKGSPVILDINMNAYFIETVGTGISYRWKESVALILELLISDQFRMAYSYDISVGDLRNANSGSHEIMLNYRFNYPKESVVSPRYF